MGPLSYDRRYLGPSMASPIKSPNLEGLALPALGLLRATVLISCIEKFRGDGPI